MRSVDVPQADKLASVRVILEAFADGSRQSVSAVSERTGVSERHVRYRIATACALELVGRDGRRVVLTARGRKLLRTGPGSNREKQQLRQAVEGCVAVREIVPDLLSDNEFDYAAVTKKIMRISRLSEATAGRRAQVFRAWRRQLV